MAGRRTNLALLVAVVTATGTGVAAFAVGTPAGRATVVAHGVAGLAVVVLAPWKQRIVRRGFRRARRARWAGVALLGLIGLTVASGFVHAMGGDVPGGVTAMQVHVGAAVAAVAPLVWHTATRRVRLRRFDVGRRDALQAGALVVAAGVTWQAAERVHGLVGAAPRRFTGSHERGTDDPARMPVTQWLFDGVPTIDAAEWSLTVADAGGTRSVGIAELLGMAQVERRAVLDCTGGWYAAQTWSGVPLSVLLDVDRRRRVIVTSHTGYARAFPAAAAGDLLLAVAVAGAPLSAGHGAPARLVASGRRGFWWVKWVARIDVDDTPPWVQPPFPLR